MFIKKLYKDTTLPTKAHSDDAGFDVYSREDKLIEPGKRYNFALGFALELVDPHRSDDKYVGLIQGKSGRAVKQGITTIGNVIDQGYRGECHAILVNLGESDIVIKSGEKIAQLLILPIANCHVLRKKEELHESKRGDGKFGSTGLTN